MIQYIKKMSDVITKHTKAEAVNRWPAVIQSLLIY